MDVLILGAGISGLAAARRLRKQSFNTVVLEARGRAGGRIWTHRDRNAAIEMGAELVHGKPLPALLKAGIKLSKLPVPKQDALETLLRRASRMSIDMSFADYLTDQEVPAEARAELIAFVEGFNAARADRISVQALAVQAGDAQAWRLEQGYDGFVAHLARGAGPIRYNAEVVEIAWRKGRVRAQLSSGEFVEAGALVCTLPLALLKANEPRFFPALDDKRIALERMEMGHASRVVLRLAERVDGFFRVARDGYNTFWGHGNLVTAWAGGRQAEAFVGLPMEIHTLDATVGLRMAVKDAHVADAYFHDWSIDPYTRGAYAYVGVDGLLAPDAIAAPVERTLFFAGEHTQVAAIGTVNGAFFSGERAAIELIQSARDPHRNTRQTA